MTISIRTGRPTKYSPELLSSTCDYLQKYVTYDDLIPSIAGLAIFLNVSRETIYAWSRQEDKQEFSDILDKILSKQEQVLLNNGLSGNFNASITKLMLSKHGYSEKKELCGVGGKDLLPPTIMIIHE